MRITICILAAGESKRFKDEKLLHMYGKKPISEHVLDKINMLNDDASTHLHKIVITKPKLLNYFKSKTSPPWHVINNCSYREGMSTSLKLAVLEAVKSNSDYLFLFLGDMPMIKKETIHSVLKQMFLSPGKIIRPVFNGQPGFPVALPKILFNELSHLQGDIGAKAVIEKHKELLIQIECKDSGSIFDIDEDIWRFKEK